MQTLREIRIAKGMTQEQLAQALGVTQGAIAQWENGQAHPAYNKLAKLTAVLGVSADELIGKEVATA